MIATDRIDRLTPEQEAQLPAIRDKWIAIGLSTERADRTRAEAAVRLAYLQGGLAAPARIVWAGSPMAGARLASSLARARSQRLAPKSSLEVRSHVTEQVTLRASNLISSQVSKAVRSEVVNQVASQVAGQVWGPVRHHIERQIEGRLDGAGYGQHDAHWIAFYDALGRLGVDVPGLEGLTELTASCGWWWPFEDVCVLSERHTVLARDGQGRLHSANGPAVAYPDGWLVYAWHGVGVAESIILHPETITIADIQSERDVEVRRVLLERYGFDRYIMDMGAMPIHADDTGTLYRCELEGDEPLVVVSVMNSTPESDATRKRYVLRVPPDMTRAREAVAWTFYQKAEDYRPALET